mgnify:CR=1 FL=1
MESDTKAALMEIHWWLRRTLPRLDQRAWDAARAPSSTTSTDPMPMLSSVRTLRKEVERHLTMAECLVHPFVGEERALTFLGTHLEEQQMVHDALQRALFVAREPLRAALVEVEALMERWFELERHLARRMLPALVWPLFDDLPPTPPSTTSSVAPSPIEPSPIEAPPIEAPTIEPPIEALVDG